VAVWTIGHSTRSLADLLARLRAHGVARVVDVRRFPHSRRHPRFDTAALARDLPAAGIAYTSTPALGGFRRPHPDSPNTALADSAFRGYADYMQTDEFAEHLVALIASAVQAPTAIMCAEAHPEACHRSFIADALVARGIDVHHILGDGPTLPHALRPHARMTNNRVTYPGHPDLFPATDRR
jgi:uncharacterized protein (DUF488 family)